MNSASLQSASLIQEKALLYNNSFVEADFLSKNEPRKKRIIVKKGSAFVVLHIQNIALFYFDRVSYALDFAGNKYLLRENLSSVEEYIERKNFFRINREAIVNIDAIVEFTAIKGGRIALRLVDGVQAHPLCVSQSLAPQFRQWVNSL